jgi:predicted RNA-binding protein with PUA-like domain
MPQHWLVKSEPSEWSWDDHWQAGTAEWDGVRNAQAQKNMGAMQKGDPVFFYHSGKGRQIVGVMEVAREAYPDPQDETGKYVLVDFRAKQPAPRPVTLQEIKATPELAELPLVKQPRLSVMPIPDDAWQVLARMAGLHS